MQTANERQMVVTALRKYGYQSQSYNCLGGDKLYFFSPRIDGVIAYVEIANVALVAGDPICAEAEIRDFCSDFLDFCSRKGWRCAFQAVTGRTLEQLQYLGFGFMRIGEEPFFDLQDFSLEGGDFRDLRRDIRRAVADGVTVREFAPGGSLDTGLRDQMEDLSREWMSQKGSGEFGFLVGRPSLDDPGDRKYFAALLDGQVEAFCVCTPVYSRNSIYFDLLRRKERPVRGTVELLITESFRLLGQQGYRYATLGTAPLSGEHTNEIEQGWFIELAMDLAFDRLGYFYSFKPIYLFKESFGPDFWEPRYLAYHPAGFHPLVIYALLKAYDPGAVRNLSRKQLTAAWNGVKWLSATPVNTLERVAGLSADGARAVLRLVSDFPVPTALPRPGMPDLPSIRGLERLRSAPGALARLKDLSGRK